MRLHEHLADDVGRDPFHIAVRGNDTHDLPVIGHGDGAHDPHVGIEAEDFIAHLPIKPAHHADDDDEHGHAQHDANDGNQRDDRNKRPLGTQVTQREKQFKRQLGHARRLDGEGASVNEPGERGDDPPIMRTSNK